MVVGVLTRYALIHCVCVLKVAQMNVQDNLIQELMIYDAEATKNICCAKSEDTVN